MSATIEQIKAMLERAGKTDLLQKQKVDLDKERLQLSATVNEEPDKSLEEAAEEWSKANTRGFVLKDKTARYVGETVDAFIAGAKWQKEQDLAEMAQSRSPLSVAYANRCFENGKQAMKEQMLKEAVEGEAEKDTIERAIAWLKEHANDYIVDLTPTYPDAPVNFVVGGKCWDDLKEYLEDGK